MLITLNKRSFTRILLSGVLLLSSSVHAKDTDEAMRIVSAAGALTEIIYELGAEDKLVGVDTTSIFPKAATELPQVGYQRALSAEGILSLSPSILLATEEAGPPAVIDQLQSTKLPIMIIPIEYTTEGVAKKIRAVSKAVGKESAGQTLIAKLEAKMAALDTKIKANVSEPKRTIFIMSMGGGSPMVAGLHTAANAMINISGGINPMTSYQGYKPINIESLVNINPEVIIVTKRTMEGLGGMDEIMKIPGLTMTDAAKNKQVAVLEDMSTLGFTPRLAEAANTIYQSIYPTAAQAAE
ncbi:heme/hemin ABC transporter substrate-binding protein [Leucothrix arctica]|uniref:Hemin ABC transporter substrate-binding protein n=1 Tax=Leucothrix arctica TaxID=1481894 RepID=A0A317CAL5_9GAMM|nr:ABC transporter substrate-binding protein [Leucothrix arctica]PWQ95181.1 hemin ABC transporter substrate-binding protein [Leucothrix arctica]